MKHPTASADLAGSALPPLNDLMRSPPCYVEIGKDITMAGDRINASVDRISALVEELGPNSSSGKLIAGALAAQRLREMRVMPDTVKLSDTGVDVTMRITKTFPDVPLASLIADPRKPWTEPTVTECATTNRRPASLTIAGDIEITPRSPGGKPWGDDVIALTKRIYEFVAPHTSGEQIQALMDSIAIDWDYQIDFNPRGFPPTVTLTKHHPMIPISPDDAAVIAGVDLPNPPVLSPRITQLVRDLEKNAKWIGGDDAWGNIDWKAGPKGLDGKGYAEDMRAAIAEIQRQAAEIARLDGAVQLNQAAFSQANASLASAQSEITELQGMLEEAIGPVRLVSELATMTDTECDFMDAGDLRLRARGELDGDFTMPRMYDGADRKRAVEAVLADRPKTNPLLAMEVVDIVASALGLRRAS